MGKRVAVHATGEPGTLYAARAGVVSIDHADQLSDETMRLMREKQIFAVPTFTIFEYFGDHAATPQAAARERQMLELHAQEFRKQLAAGVPMAVGSDVGPVSPRHAGPRIRTDGEVRHDAAGRDAGRHIERRKTAGMGGPDRIAEAGYLADVIAVPGDPLQDVRRSGESQLRDEGRDNLQEVGQRVLFRTTNSAGDAA